MVGVSLDPSSGADAGSTKQAGTGKKFDAGKPPLALIPPVAMYAEASAFADGQRKYGTWNYMRGLSALRLASGVLRHIYAWLGGELLASDSGIHHLGHARAGLAMILALEEAGKLDDDRLHSVPPDAEATDTSDMRTVEGGGTRTLEVGKTYLDRGGRLVTIDGFDPARSWGGAAQPYLSNEQCYHYSGKFSYKDPNPFHMDLVEEVSDATCKPSVGDSTGEA